MVKQIYKKKKLRLKAKEKRKNEILKRCEMDLTDWNVIEKFFGTKFIVSLLTKLNLIFCKKNFDYLSSIT